MLAPDVDVDSVTLNALVYVPGGGLNVGIDTVPVIVYAPLDTDDVVHPTWYATALIVMDDETGIGVEYTVPTVSLGTEPSVVYRMLAPDVVVDSVTYCVLVYVAAAGLNVGADTVPVGGNASQASPMPSLFESCWRGLNTEGQLSVVSGIPSPS
jgi:hypothetical protein